MAYKRMTYETRQQIERFYNVLHFNAVKIAELLGYSHVAIYAELKKGFWMKRNWDWTETKRYSADRAQQAADFNRTTKGAQLKIGNDHDTLAVIERLILKRKLSPAAALATIEREHIPVKTKMCVTTGLIHLAPNKNTRKENKRKTAFSVTKMAGKAVFR